MRQAFLPVRPEQLGLFGDGIDVVGKGLRYDVGFEAVDHRPGLFASAAVGLLDGDVIAGLGLPVLGEGGVEVLVQLARRVVGDVEQADVGGVGAGDEGERANAGQGQLAPVEMLFHGISSAGE